MAISGTSLLPVGRQRALYNEAQKEYENYINYVNAERERAAAEAAKSKNKGGFLGGLGYLGEKIGLGFLSGIEGIWDFSAGGIAKLFGADDWAEEQFDDDWVNYNHADEWYNPSDSWKVAGDVAGGIGSSLPSVAGAAAGAAIIAASGGTLSAVGGKLIVASISAGIAGLGAAGNATKEAYRETGRLTGKEFGYGALSGATEAGIEFATAGIAKGTGRLASKFGNKAANETAQAVAKTVTKKGFFRELGEDFVTEAFEEGFSEFISPYYKRATYDPDAELASASEIAYASIIGGISGSIMTGVPATINTTANLISGKSSVDKGTAAGVLEQGRVITERENEVFNRTKPSAEATETTETTTEAPQATTENTEKSNATTETESGTGIGAFEAVSDTYTKLMESLKKHNNFTGTDSELIELAKTGNVKFNAKEMMQLGQLKKDGALARLHPYIERSAEALVLDADTMAQRYSAYGMTDTNGKAINVTAEQILSGIDSSLVQKAKEGTLSDAEARTLTKQLRKALKSNTVLSTLATAEATGNIFVDTKRMTESIINGENLASTADLNRVIEQGSIEEKRDLGKALGIQDWSTVTGDELRSRISYLAQNGGLTEYAAQSKRIKKALAEGKEKSKPLPHMLRKNMEDGVYRYTNEDGTVDMAILKDGENYYLYDYEGKRISRALTSKEINGILKKYWTSGQTTTAESMKSPNEVESTDTSRKVDELDALAFENIPEYKSLSEPNQAAIRMTLRQALANGLSEADALTMARFAAKSGLNVIFNASKAVGDGCFVGNTVYVNPNISIERTFDMVLGHEMFHAIFVKGGKRAMKLYNEAKEFIDSKKAKEVENRYKEFYAELKVEKSIAEAISKEEVSAHGSEEVFKSKEAWEYILGEDSSIGDGVLSFFRKSARKYSEIQQMSARARKFIRHYKKLFDAISARNQGSNSLSLALDGAQRKMPIVDRMGENVKLTGEEEIPRYKTPEEAKDSGDVSDARFSLAFSKDIAEKQREYVDRGYAKITPEELEKALSDTARMVEIMQPYSNILPQDKVGKTLVKNGSYDVSVENTTVCIRTLAYNSFVDMVSEKVGRPLTQMESFLVSQKLYEIAKEPQCLYCYVSLDRKAFNEMVIRYVEQRDAAIKAYEEAGKPKIPSSMNAEWSLFKAFLDGRKPTTNMWDRYVGWLKAYNNGDKLVTLADISTEAKRLELVESKGTESAQVKDILKYAQSASWAKKQMQYVAYYDEILKLKPQVIRNLNSHYGMRWYSFSDYSGAFIVENMQQITDAAIRGLKGLSYTKDTDFAEIFAPTGMNINISVYAKKNKDGGYEIDAKQSANIDEAIKLRKKYPNVGIVVVATDAEGVEWALSQEWSDVVIPFHTVRTGADVAEFYNWQIFNAEQSDTVTDQNLWDAYVNSVGNKKASKMVYPSEHQNDRETYLRICKERGLTPRFKSFLENPNYMKLVNETRQSESQTTPLKAKFNLEAAEHSFNKFVEKGGYYEGWYNDGIDVDGEAEIVAEDVKSGKKANEVSYGRQDISPEDLTKSRKTIRQHGARYALTDENKKITAEMSDAERTEILSKKKVLAPIYTGQADATILANKDAFEQKKMDIVKTVIATLGDEFGLVGGQISFEDVDIEVTLSKTNLRESTTKQATPAQLAKLIPVLKPAAQTAVGIERHDNRYFFDNDTVYFDNLLGGYIDGEDFVPVRFGLKHSRTGNTVLYVVVDQNKIPVSNLTEIKNDTGHQDAKSDLTEVGGPRRRVTYSIAQIIQFVNSGDVLRYLPDELLSEEQKVTKWKAVAETEKYTAEKNDKKYFDYIKNGNLRDARRMIIAAARAAGYTIEGYHGTRQTFTAFSSESKGSNTNTETSKRMFFAADKATANSYYPYGMMQAIHERHPEWAWADPEKVKVKGNLYHLFIRMSNPLTVDVADYDYAAHRDNADSLMEFVTQAEENHNDGIILLNAMDNQLDTSARASTVYMFAQPSQAKSAETITYDDEGNIIPISKRFNAGNPDMRFALTGNETSIPDFEIASGSIDRIEHKSYKERFTENAKAAKSGFVPGIVATEIQLTNAQAGIEHAGKKLGVKNVEALVQRCRASRSIAQEMLGGSQWKILPGATKDQVIKVGEGLEPIFAEIKDKRKGETKAQAEARYTAYQYYLYHKHNIDRMSLEQRSIDKHNADIQKRDDLIAEYNKVKNRFDSNKKARAELKGKYDNESKQKRKKLIEKIHSDKILLETLEKQIDKLKKEIDAFVPEENKPVLRKVENGQETAVTAKESEEIVKKYEEAYPEFSENSQKVYKFLNNLLEMQVEYGLIDRATYEYLTEKYPHYVPTYRKDVKMGTAAVRGKGNIEVAKTVNTAKGSIKDLEDLELSISRMVQRVVSAGNVNVLANKLYSASLANNNTAFVEEVSRSKAENIIENDGELERPKHNQINIYRDGERITLATTHEVFQGFDEFNSRDEASILPVRAVSKVTSVFKTLVTSANPIFLVRNLIRDFQDAGINTKYFKSFFRNYRRAIYHLMFNTEYAQLYRAAGGFNASIFDYADGFTGKQSKMGFSNSKKRTKWLVQKIENANMFIEQLPRFAEFISTIEAGGSVDQAILNAAEVTTNFGRAGKLTRKLNATIIPFLNPAVQGLSKIYRNAKDALHSKRAFASLVIKCVILGIVPMALNNLLYNDDEEYDDLRATDKENYYLFHIGNTWIKIPRGRFVSVLAGATNRTTDAIKGEEVDWKEYVDNIISNVTPVENFTRPIWSPLTDAANNKTWYGGDIEGVQFENVRPSQRYDESTSSIAKWLGEKFNYSPKKIHYLLDQYSGVIGDFVLPATTQKAEKSAALSAFVFDPVTNNKLSDDFYKLFEEAKYDKSDGDNTAIYQYKYLNEVKQAVSEMYDEISDIQTSDLSNAEKLQQTRVIRVLINNAYKTATSDYEAVTKAIESTAGLFDESTENGVKMRYTEITHRVFGAEKAFETYSSSVAEKMKLLNLSGVDYDVLYQYYFGTKDIRNDVDKKGNEISGTKRSKVIAAINSLNVSREQKILMIYAKGYAVKDGDIRGVTADRAKTLLLNYILRSSKLSKVQKEELTKMCGFEVKNGRILVKSSK